MGHEDRIYLDYNATAPVSTAVLEALSKGGWSIANPSSVHASGKKARREISRVSDYLYETFGLSDNHFDLVFHSGATEGVNSLVKGLALKAKKEGRDFLFAHFESDHSCVSNQGKFLDILGHQTLCLPIQKDGSISLEAIKGILKEHQNKTILLNWTWVNNESGVVLPLSQAEELKREIGCLVHVDAVQTVGKIPDWRSTSDCLDFYTYSGHKFGALKGIGFSFERNTEQPCPLLNGGGQQLGLRSGTENTWGIFSLKLALESLEKNFNFEENLKAKTFFESKLSGLLEGKGEIAGFDNPHRNGNTTYFILNDVLANNSAMAFDMSGFDLSNGSACSSGAVIPSRVLLGMGYSEIQAKSALRVSFSPFAKEADIKIWWESFEKTLRRFL